MHEPKSGRLAFGRGALTLGTFVLAAATLASTGCISDTDCGICDPDNLVLETLSGKNYADRKIQLLTDGVDEGKYFIEDIGACVETEAAQEAPRGAEEWCKISPLITWQGLELVFNNLLEPTSIELVRKQPDNPNLFEVYDWKSRILKIEGPITRYNGDYIVGPGEDPDLMTRQVSLTCVDNLAAIGVDYNHEVADADPTICNGFHDAPNGDQIPLKMQFEGETKAYDGVTDWRTFSCSAPDSGADTCCSVCDYELSVNVAKYGVDAPGGTALTPASAIQCDPNGNIYEECTGFVTDINREFETNRYRYEWAGEFIDVRLPKYDMVRETHPDQRPDGIEPDGVPCSVNADCDAALGGDSGAVCIGETADGLACDDDTEECGDRHCKAEWFGTCKADNATLGAQGYCVDRRFKDRGAGACYVAQSNFVSCDPNTQACTNWEAGNRLARCDAGEFPDGNLSAEECCQDALGGDPAACDPLFQDNVVSLPRYDRDQALPDEVRECYCGNPNNQNGECATFIDEYCTEPWGSVQRHDGESNEGSYITRFVTKRGGVIYDPALKGVLFLPGDRGGEKRSLVESCASTATAPDLIAGRNPQDGWRMHDSVTPENFENYERGMCSGSEYRVEFATDGEYIQDKIGNDLTGKSTYVFETPEFHIVPGSGFPTDNLRIGACDDFQMRFSNRYDLDPNNLKKLELWQVMRKDSGTDENGDSCDVSNRPECWDTDFRVAGGLACSEDPEEINASGGDVAPCMIVNISLQDEATVNVSVDSVRYGINLFNYDENGSNSDSFGRTLTGRYRMVVPGLEGVEKFSDLNLGDPDDVAAYNASFHDVCGMPLVTSGGQGYTDFLYDFTIDPPKCKEDKDGDGVQLSCDNSRDYYNPEQEDQDLDGFGDVADSCPLTVQSSITGDSDRDGVGNECDSCRQQASKYNTDAAVNYSAKMWVRNVPFQQDFDQDGIGDVCDNCVVAPNCSGFGPAEDGLTPHSVGVPVPYEEEGVCQTDMDFDMIGDSCFDDGAPINLPDAAGPVGFDNAEDFDQDGINNLEDYCPRQPIELGERLTCTTDDDCPGSRSCAGTPANDGNQYCNHFDSDTNNQGDVVGDQVGDECDTCPFSPNNSQVTDNGMQLDDEDGDFVGVDCETYADCTIRQDARPYGFFEVSVNGLCCTTLFPGGDDGAGGEYVQDDDGDWDCVGLCDPDKFPIRTDCADENEAIPGEDVPDGTKCRKLPNAVANYPGVVTLPPGCQEARDTAEMNGADSSIFDRRLTQTDYPDADELWGKMCFLPQWDQDFDGIGDACDRCPFAYDPFNEPYVDENTGKLWDTYNFGRFCAGDYDIDVLCAADDPDDEGTGTGTETGE